MANDVTDTVRGALGNVLREALKNANDVTPTKSKSGPLSGAKGIATGLGLAAAAPLVAKKGMQAARANGMGPSALAGKAASKVSDGVGSKVKDVVSSKVDEAGGAGGIAKEAAGGLIPGLGGGDSDGNSKGGAPGTGKGRRMPIQQSVDVAVPIETAYNQWTQFEDWPNFMHRVTNVSQDEPETVKFSTKIWGKTKEFEAKIDTQRPDERVKWRVAQGITHTGVVTFHELAPRLTRIELTMDVDPGSLIEKAARGMRHIKRAVRGDLHRFKAFIEVQENETGAWRGVIEDGEVVEDHDESYDKEREYSDIDDIMEDEEDEEGDEDSEDEDEDEGQNGNGGGRERTQRFKRQAERTRGSSSSRSGGGSSSNRRSGGSSSGSRSKSASSGSRSKSASSSGRSAKAKSSSSRRSKSSSSRS